MFADMPAELSSLYYTGNYVAGYGNDGVRSTHFHTKCRIGEWWRVDLQMKRCVKAIRITNREENHRGLYVDLMLLLNELLGNTLGRKTESRISNLGHYVIVYVCL